MPTLRELEERDKLRGASTFDPEGAGFDEATAKRIGLKPDETGHFPSRDPATGLILKGRKHPTFDKTLEGERAAGFEIFKGADGRYYSRPREGAAPAIGGAKTLRQLEAEGGAGVTPKRARRPKTLAQIEEEARPITVQTREGLQANINPEPFTEALMERLDNIMRPSELIKPMLSPLDTAGEIIKTSVAVTEALASMGTGLFGSIIGLYKTGLESLWNAFEPPKTMNDVLTGVPGFNFNIKTFYRTLFDTLPDNVNENVERFSYEPRTEDGQAAIGLLGMAFHEIGGLGEQAGDLVMEKTGNRAAATLARIMPEATIMLGGIRLAKGRSAFEDTLGVLEDTIVRRVEGENITVFDAVKVDREFPGLSEAQQLRETAVVDRMNTLEKIPYESRTLRQQEELSSLKVEMEELAAAKFRTTETETLTIMKPDEVLALADTTQAGKIDAGKVNTILEEARKTNPDDLVKKFEDEGLVREELADGEGVITWATEPGKVQLTVTGKKGKPDSVKTFETVEAAVDALVSQRPRRTVEAVELVRDGTELTVTKGLEEAIVAHTLGETRVPVRIKEKKLDPATVQDFSKRVHTLQESARKKREALDKKAKRTVWETFATMAFDKQFVAKKRLVLEAGDLGRDAVMHLELLTGASTAAKVYMERVINDIFNKVSEAKVALTITGKDGKPIRMTEVHVLDSIVDAMRNVQIGKRRAIFTFQFGTKQAHFKAVLEQFEKDLGVAEFNRYKDIANQIFDVHREMLDLLLSEGLISKTLHKKIRTFDYEPRKFLDLVDPWELRTTKGEAPITVRSSGVEFLESGARSPVEMSAKTLVFENISRTYQRVFKNRANKALAEIADAHPGNSMVRRVGAKKQQQKRGTTTISYFEKGVEKKLALEGDFAKMWVKMSPDVSMPVTNWIRWGLGTPIVKATAVGINPEFFLTDFPRNIAHAWIAAQRDFRGNKLYSSTLPVFLTEMAVDMIAVARDVTKKEGLFKDLAEAGGFPNFLAEIGRGEGRELTGGALSKIDPTRGGASQRAYNKTIKGLAWANAWSEGMMRTAVGRRTLERQRQRGEAPDITKAAHESRRIIDYGQAGRASRVADHALPFFNPAVQATRTALRGFKEDPIAGSWIALQVFGTTAMTYMWNYSYNAEATKSISDAHMVTGGNIVFSPAMDAIDDDNNPIYPYAHLPTENVFMPIIALANMMMRSQFEDRVPTDLWFTVFKRASVITPAGLMPPLMNLLISTASGIDFWNNRKLWTRGEDVEGWAQYYTEASHRMTPRWYVHMGRWMHEVLGWKDFPNPVRMQAAVDSVIADHPASRIAGEYGRQVIWGDTPTYMQKRSMWEFWTDQAFVRRWIKMGRPAINQRNDMDRYRGQTATQQKLANDKIDGMIDAVIAGEASEELVISHIEQGEGQVPFEETERQANRLLAGLKYHEVTRHWSNEMRVGMPSMDTLQSMASGSPRDNARTAYDWWKRMTNEQRGRMDTMFGSFPKIGGSIPFWAEYEHLKETEGRDHDTHSIWGETLFLPKR